MLRELRESCGQGTEGEARRRLYVATLVQNNTEIWHLTCVVATTSTMCFPDKPCVGYSYSVTLRALTAS